LKAEHFEFQLQRKFNKCQLWTRSKKLSHKNIDFTLKSAENVEPETLQQRRNVENAEAKVYAGRKEKS